MAHAQFVTVQIPPAAPGSKPSDAEIDLFGLSHPGRVRKENQDHFLLCTMHRQLVVHATSLPQPDRLSLRSERLATLGMVADGVGGSAAGAEASRIAVETVARYVTCTINCFDTHDPDLEVEFVNAMRDAALEAHKTVLARGSEAKELEGLATTLTLAIAAWPRLYILQVGDSRCYYHHDDELTLVTRDQTVAQDLIDRGVLRHSSAETSPFRHVLASALGGGEAMPVVSTLILKRGNAVLLCSDGLTKHVSDDEITSHLARIESSEKACRELVDLALERGGSDNITVLIGRSKKEA